MKNQKLTDLEIAIKLEEIEREVPMKHTAVDWMFCRLWETPKDKFTWDSILQEAKQREKMQIESAHRHGASDFILHRYKMEQYYNDTYGKDG